MKYIILVLVSLSLAFSSCKRYVDLYPDIDREKYPSWSEQTHGDLTYPVYSEVFRSDEVLRFDIKIDPSYRNMMEAHLKNLVESATYDNFGNAVLAETPVMVPCSFYFKGREWYSAGIRFKGANSLVNSYNSGVKKLSFKLDFDEFEDATPGLKNQRFYGFKQLNLYNNSNDQSFVREKVVSDLFRSFGINTPHTSFCVVYVDYGSGSQYHGVYTLIEEVDDTMLKCQLGSSEGNLYKPTGIAGTLSDGTYKAEEMGKASNTLQADYTDVEILHSVINSPDRLTNTDLWKHNLESIFDVSGFLKTLAANTIIENRDSYGNTFLNYMLYNHNNVFVWIPYDYNKTLVLGKKSALSLSMSEISAYWPLIRYLLDDAGYKQLYNSYLESFVGSIYSPEKMDELYSKYSTMLKVYAYSESDGYTYLTSDAEFDASISEVKYHAQNRKTIVDIYLNSLK